jgi:hypothetical protein
VLYFSDDGVKEIVVGRNGGVTAYNYVNRQLVVKNGWPYSINAEVRGLAGGNIHFSFSFSFSL